MFNIFFICEMTWYFNVLYMLFWSLEQFEIGQKLESNDVWSKFLANVKYGVKRKGEIKNEFNK